MSDREKRLEEIAAIISDYRRGELESPTVEHVDRWIKQFPKGVQDPILTEMAYVLDKTYFTKANVESFLRHVIQNKKLAGDSPCDFWKGVSFLRLQTAGNSQKDMLTTFDRLLREQCQFGVSDCGAQPHTYLYLDDVLFSGGRVKSDLVKWIEKAAPNKAKVAVLLIGLHTLGQWFAKTDIEKCAKAHGKQIDLTWWFVQEIEDRKAHMAVADVLRPSSIPDEAATLQYVQSLGVAPILRTPGNVGALKNFSSEQGRHLLEQEFLKAGVRVREMCNHLNAYMRPLGNTLLKTTGFGSMIVTHRNCPNNAPLVLWAGDPWYPLFPRKTN